MIGHLEKALAATGTKRRKATPHNALKKGIKISKSLKKKKIKN
jgi:hypothetical protein